MKIIIQDKVKKFLAKKNQHILTVELEMSQSC